MYDPTKPYKKQIFELISKTWISPYISVKKDIYPVMERKINAKEIDHTDGIGSKGVYHWQMRTFKNAVLDALAMNLNDLALMRAVPYKLQNQITLPIDDHEAIIKIISHLSLECRKRKIVMTGGETSIHDNITGMDISMTVSGLIFNSKANEIKAGDLIIGFKSNGLHSNGFSKVREILGNITRKEFTAPTVIYLDEVLKLNKKFDIHGLMHITGGAFTKLKDIAWKTNIFIDNTHRLRPQKIFYDLYSHGVADEEMYRTFNCGIGFIITAAEKDAQEIIKLYPKKTDIIGRAEIGSGKIEIDSFFSKKKIRL